jgi:hypothetical protein
MDSQKTGNWIQVITGVAVLVGLGLVIWELQQTRDLVRAQLVSDERLAAIDKRLAIMGENPAPIIVKGCLAPSTLTAEEFLVYVQYLQIQTNEDERKRIIEEVSGLEMGWQNRIENSMREYLGTKLGRLSYELANKTWQEEARLVAERLLASGSIENCEIGFNRFLKAMQSDKDPRNS